VSGESATNLAQVAHRIDVLDVLTAQQLLELGGHLAKGDGERAAVIGRVYSKRGSSPLLDLLIELESASLDVRALVRIEALARGRVRQGCERS
jgi:hypothetical protein